MGGPLKGRVALISGAASGIGLATAQRLACDGVRVVLGDVDRAAVERVAQDIRAEGGEALAVTLDVADAKSAAAAIQEVESRVGPVDVLVNNAGVGTAGTILTTAAEEWDRMMTINVKGIFHLCRAAVPSMIARQQGVIINISSVAATVGLKDRAAYSASKGAVLALTRAMQADWMEHGIRVNAVLPGTIESPWVDRMTKDQPDPQAARAQMAARQPIQRMGSTRGIADVVAFLASDQASFVWGAAWTADGGLTAF